MKNDYSYEPNTASEWFDILLSVGVDYDGCETAESLKGLVDELLMFARNAMTCMENGQLYPGQGNTDDEYVLKSDIVKQFQRNYDLSTGPEFSVKEKWQRSNEYRRIKKALSSVPTQSVKPIIYARWELCGKFDDFVQCSHCRSEKYPLAEMSNMPFCQKCGASMRDFLGKKIK